MFMYVWSREFTVTTSVLLFVCILNADSYEISYIYVIRNANTSHIFNIVAVELKHVRILIWAAFREVHSLFNRHYYNHLRQ